MRFLEVTPARIRRQGAEGGMILIFSVVAVLLIAGLSTAFLTLRLSSSRLASAQVTTTSAFYVAEAGLDEVLLRITHRFQNTIWNHTDLDSRFSQLDAIDAPGDGSGTVFRDSATGALFQSFPLGPGLATVRVESQAATVRDPAGRAVGLARDLQIVSWGTVDGVTYSVQKNMRYQVSSTHRFEFALLAKELPECMFCHLHVYGDIGQVSSRQFKMWSPYDRFGYERTAVFGDLYLKGTFSSSSRDQNGASLGRNQERIVTDQGGRIYQSFTGQKLAEWSPLRPYFRRDSWYDSLARSEDSSIRLTSEPARDLQQALDEQKALMVVVPREKTLSLSSQSLRRVGPVVEGHLVLIGTAHEPLRIDKSVTVHGDVLIKGTVTGVGNINASGNIFIVDSIRYANPPRDPTNAEAGAAGGGPADKLGLSSASNILIGDLTHPLTAQFIQVQFVDVQSSGYEWVPAEYLNNRYALDGNRDLAPRAVGGHTVDTPGLLPEGAVGGLYSPMNGLHYSAGWLSWGLLDLLSNYSLNRIDATLFADHAIAGGQPASPSLVTMAGGVVARDLGILCARSNSSTAFTIYYDNRNRTGNPMGFPLESAVFETAWFRIPPRT